MKVRVTSPAARDIYDISRLYAGLNRRLGVRFIHELERIQTLLADNPRMGFQIAHGYRRILLQHFPYAVVYAITTRVNLIRIVAVVHQSRRPDYWWNHIQEESAIYAIAA